MTGVTLLTGDCKQVLRTLDLHSVDAVVTDPPYELRFMGKSWDQSGVAFDPWMWHEVLRVLKPGGHMLAFGGTRTHHRMMVAIEDAGFEIRDCLMWLYGSGFPKSLNVSKAIDKAAGVEREVIGRRADGRYAYEFNGTANRPTGGVVGTEDAERIGGFVSDKASITAPATDLARQWDGWGTALKPAYEPIILARKPLIGTVARNVMEHGVGGINIDACRIETTENLNGGAYAKEGADRHDGAENWRYKREGGAGQYQQPEGRWPANILLDEEAASMLDQQTGKTSTTGKRTQSSKDALVEGTVWGWGNVNHKSVEYPGDSGGASRFFYCAKASKSEREAGLDDVDATHRANGNKWTDQDYRVVSGERSEGQTPGPRKNTHPTVKPISLMRYLCKLVTPPGGVILDPFIGSGSTGAAARLEGFSIIGIDNDPSSIAIAERRIAHWESV